ncbi:hypothetical protein Desmer_3042 [Desulfosporosinus meridiei DSM 13257]|uniref:DUF4083 domain-containing protein n=1 Tax=Desulfosporosinus meridiei (strain ATCC BAA-275 / DSM 13257 / KCTC 12902 / NCIMB 13706 / S10) TaxID=768704 RepID=J7IT95_DESMD|nr:hypothetical protein Desmer_3042 [Desulfosporosinus meridiei DSM 13257]
MGGNPIQFDYSVLLSVMFPMLFCLIFFIFTIYLMVSALRFFKHKERADSELLEKLDMLIKIQTQQSANKS